MKKGLRRMGVIVLVGGFFGGPLWAEPAQHHISMKVTADASVDTKKISGSSVRSRVQNRQLTIALDNRDKEVVDGVSVKWTIYARTMDGGHLVTVKEGTEKPKLAALQTTTVKTPVVTFKGTPQHAVTTQKNSGKGKTQATSKREPATGEEYYGYAVQVYEGSTLLDEEYSQPSLKNHK